MENNRKQENYDVIIIKKNDYKIKGTSDIEPNKIMEKIFPLMRTVTVKSQENMMKLVIETIKMTDEMLGTTSVCYSDHKNIYQLCHLSPEDNNEISDKEKLNKIRNEDEANNLCCYLLRKKIYGDCVFIKSKITENHLCKSVSTTKKDIVNVLMRTVSRKCIKLFTNGNRSELIYYNDPLELLVTSNANADDVKKKFTFVELNIFKFTLMLYVKKNTQDQKINKLATRLVGNKKIYGDVIVTSMSGQYSFDNLDEVLFNKIINICGGPLANRDLLDNEKDIELNNYELPTVRTKHVIVEERYKKHLQKQNVCDGCGIQYEKLFNCTGCFRMSYHSKSCQDQHWKQHKNNCLHKTNTL